MNPDKNKYSLQRKVQFDIQFFFTRHGAENVESQDMELWYLKKCKDELTKNHKHPESLESGYMPENPTD